MTFLWKRSLVLTTRRMLSSSKLPELIPDLHDVAIIRRGVSDGPQKSHKRVKARATDALCQNSGGKFFGLVAAEKNKGLMAGGRLHSASFPDNFRHCEVPSSLTGKIYSIYDAPSQKPEDECCVVGSGFLVSPSLIASTAHVCEPTFVDNNIPFTLKAVYFTLESDVFSIDPYDISSDPDCTKVVPLPQPSQHPS